MLIDETFGRLDAGLLYYMEFLEKAFDGSITVEVKVCPI